MDDRIRHLENGAEYTIAEPSTNRYNACYQDVPLSDIVRGIVTHLGIKLKYEPARGSHVRLSSKVLFEEKE